MLRIVSLDYSEKKLLGVFARSKNTPQARKFKNPPNILLLSQGKSTYPLNPAVELDSTGKFSFCFTELKMCPRYTEYSSMVT
jgi:hypothetical protein